KSPCECFQKTVALEKSIVHHSRRLNLYDNEQRAFYSDKLDSLNHLLNRLETTLGHCQSSFYAKSEYCDSIYHDITIWEIPESNGKPTVHAFTQHFRNLYTGNWELDSLRNSRSVKLDSLLL